MLKTIRAFAFAAGLAALPASSQVKITPGPEKIHIEILGKPFSDFYVAGDDVTKPYLHPLRAASGTYVTRMWPMEKVEEEAAILKPDHKHHRGMWFAHDSVNGLDFWNNEASYTTPNRGKIVLEKLGAISSGRERGSIAATFAWESLDGHKVLDESRLMTFWGTAKLRVVDVDITLTPVEKVTFGDGKDGAFGIRMRPALREDPNGGVIVNADGLRGEKEVWGKPSDWCDYSGEVNGEKVGIAILDNPANPRHPVRWHARAYGLFAANPFGVSALDKTQPKSDLVVEAGQSLRFRYRVIIHEGDAAAAGIAAMWKQYEGGESASIPAASGKEHDPARAGLARQQ